MKKALRYLLGFAVGVVLGVFFHYVLYRFAMPSEPFIYFAL